MSDGIFLSTVRPYRNDWNGGEPILIENIDELKPKPDQDVLLIIGDAWNVLEDFKRFLDFDVEYDLCAVNFSPLIIPKNQKIHHYVAGDSHHKQMQRVAARIENQDTLRHCWNSKQPHFDIYWKRYTSKGWTGTTTNLGLRLGIALGYLKIVLAGCPMDGNGNWYKNDLPVNDIKRNKDHTAHLWKWTEIASRPIGRFIRSMSGNTANLFGEPTKQWLET